MHYGIIAIGSRGDVQPFLGLALGLLDRGHSATVMAHENFKRFVEGYGLGFHPLPGNIEEMLHTDEGRKVLESGSIITFMRFVRRNVAANQTQVNEALVAGCKNADVLVTSLLGMIWVDAIAESSGKPWATIQLSFPSTRTGEFPFPLLDFFDFPLYNRFTYRLFEYLYSKDYKKQLNQFRHSLGLPAVQGSILKKIAAEKSPNLYALSPALLPRPTDWDKRSQLTGFIYLPAARRKENPMDHVPETLIRWLEAGEKPIYIGFGSIPVPDPARFVHTLTQLLEETSYRILFCQGWSRLDGLPENPRLFTIASGDHDFLFPRCRAAIIHGGIGTLAAGLRARIPLVIASIVADQPWWGKLIARRGLGAFLPFHRWTTERLIAAIRVTETPAIQCQVIRIGDQINREDGLHQTIAALEMYFMTTTPKAPADV
ncbi:MAG TPA: glycosyltransferase [Puia sp.]|nr:glycosyltransferase [Puia sp.]